MYNPGQPVAGERDGAVQAQADQPHREIPLVIEARFQIPGFGGVARLGIRKGSVLQHADQHVLLPRLHPLIHHCLKGVVHPLMSADFLAVEIDLRLIVDSLEAQEQGILQILRIQGKGGAVDPPAVGDPFAGQTVLPIVGILDPASRAPGRGSSRSAREAGRPPECAGKSPAAREACPLPARERRRLLS